MEEKSSFLSDLGKFVGWVIALDIFTIAVAGVYFLAGGKSDWHDFGEMIIGAGIIVGVIGIFIIGRNPTYTYLRYRPKTSNENDLQENKVKKAIRRYRKTVRVGLVFIISGITIFLVGFCILQYPFPSEVLPEVEVLSAKEIYPEALDLALSWSDNAKLKQIRVSMIGPNNSWEINEVSFDFVATEYPGEFLYVRCSYSSCIRKTYDRDYYNVPSIEFDEVEIDSVEAAQIGLVNGGAEYIKKSGGMGNLTLRWSQENTLEWLLYYSVYNCNTCSALYLYINPYTGEVIDKE